MITRILIFIYWLGLPGLSFASYHEIANRAYEHYRQARLDEVNLCEDDLGKTAIEHLEKSHDLLEAALKINQFSAEVFYRHIIQALLALDVKVAFDHLIQAKIAYERHQDFYADESPAHLLAQVLIRQALAHQGKRLVPFGLVLHDLAERTKHDFYFLVAAYDSGNVAAGYLDYSTPGDDPVRRQQALKSILGCAVRDLEILSRVTQEKSWIAYEFHRQTQREAHIIDALELNNRSIQFSAQANLPPGSDYPDSLRSDREVYRQQYVNWALGMQDWAKAFDLLQAYIGATPDLHLLGEYDEALIFANLGIDLCPNMQQNGGLTAEQETYFEAIHIWKQLYALKASDPALIHEARTQLAGFYRTVGKDELADQLDQMTVDDLKTSFIQQHALVRERRP